MYPAHCLWYSGLMSANPINRAMPWEARDWKSTSAVSYSTQEPKNYVHIYTAYTLWRCSMKSWASLWNYIYIYMWTLWPESWLGCQRNSMWLLQHVVSLLVYQYAVHKYERLDSTSAEWKCFRCEFTFPEDSLYHSYNVEVSNSLAYWWVPCLMTAFSLTPQCLLNFCPHHAAEHFHQGGFYMPRAGLPLSTAPIPSVTPGRPHHILPFQTKRRIYFFVNYL